MLIKLSWNCPSLENGLAYGLPGTKETKQRKRDKRKEISYRNSIQGQQKRNNILRTKEQIQHWERKKRKKPDRNSIYNERIDTTFRTKKDATFRMEEKIQHLEWKKRFII